MFAMLCIHESKVHSLAFKCLVWPQLEYACQVWNPHLVKDIQMLEAIEKHAARWIHAKWNYDTYTWSKTTEVCKNFAGQALLTDVTIYVLHSCLILHIRGVLYSLILIAPSKLLLISLQTVNSSINAYRCSYFVNIPFLWNSALCHCLLPANSDKIYVLIFSLS